MDENRRGAWRDEDWRGALPASWAGGHEDGRVGLLPLWAGARLPARAAAIAELRLAAARHVVAPRIVLDHRRAPGAARPADVLGELERGLVHLTVSAEVLEAVLHFVLAAEAGDRAAAWGGALARGVITEGMRAILLRGEEATA